MVASVTNTPNAPRSEYARPAERLPEGTDKAKFKEVGTARVWDWAKKDLIDSGNAHPTAGDIANRVKDYAQANAGRLNLNKLLPNDQVILPAAMPKYTAPTTTAAERRHAATSPAGQAAAQKQTADTRAAAEAERKQQQPGYEKAVTELVQTAHAAGIGPEQFNNAREYAGRLRDNKPAFDAIKDPALKQALSTLADSAPVEVAAKKHQLGMADRTPAQSTAIGIANLLGRTGPTLDASELTSAKRLLDNAKTRGVSGEEVDALRAKVAATENASATPTAAAAPTQPARTAAAATPAALPTPASRAADGLAAIKKEITEGKVDSNTLPRVNRALDQARSLNVAGADVDALRAWVAETASKAVNDALASLNKSPDNAALSHAKKTVKLAEASGVAPANIDALKKAIGATTAAIVNAENARLTA